LIAEAVLSRRMINTIRLLKTTATFGVGFVMRPIGGVLMGIYADRQGAQGGDADHHQR
jgi:hypothetical protein